MKIYVRLWNDFSEFFLDWEIVSETSFRQNQNTNFMFTNFSPEILTDYEVLWKNMVQSRRPRSNMAQCIFVLEKKATKKHSECVVLIAIPRQQ